MCLGTKYNEAEGIKCASDTATYTVKKSNIKYKASHTSPSVKATL